MQTPDPMASLPSLGWKVQTVTGGADGEGLGLKGGMPGVNTLDLSLLFPSALIMILRDTSDSLKV